MFLTAHNLDERARWLLPMRWIACLGVLLAAGLIRTLTGPHADVRPLFAIAAAIGAYNYIFLLIYRKRKRPCESRRSSKFLIVLQISLDLLALTMLLYFSGLPFNPFILYYVFHLIIASILLPGWIPYFLAILATMLVGSMLLLQAWNWIPTHALAPAWIVLEHAAGADKGYYLYLLGVLVAVFSTLVITVYLTTSVSGYVEKVQAQIRQHQKMLGIAQLVAGFAHQVSNPLDGLQNGLRQIGQRACGDPVLEETVPKMMAALERIGKVARRLQEFARPQGLQLQACDIPKAIEVTLQLFGKILSERKVELQTAYPPVPLAWGDPYSVEEIIFNLCTNALDAMPQGGTLFVRTYFVERLEVNSAGCVAIEVQDTGQGIAPDKLEKIFEPFFTTKSQCGGTGLGLSLCRMLLAEMGGQIEVESVPEKGTTFRIILPTALGKLGEERVGATATENGGFAG